MIGQLSPDGRWRWDGTRWAPVAVPPPPPPPDPLAAAYRPGPLPPAAAAPAATPGASEPHLVSALLLAALGVGILALGSSDLGAACLLPAAVTLLAAAEAAFPARFARLPGVFHRPLLTEFTLAAWTLTAIWFSFFAMVVLVPAGVILGRHRRQDLVHVDLRRLLHGWRLMLLAAAAVAGLSFAFDWRDTQSTSTYSTSYRSCSGHHCSVYTTVHPGFVSSSSAAGDTAIVLVPGLVLLAILVWAAAASGALGTGTRPSWVRFLPLLGVAVLLAWPFVAFRDQMAPVSGYGYAGQSGAGGGGGGAIVYYLAVLGLAAAVLLSLRSPRPPPEHAGA